MARVKKGVNAHKRHKKILKQAKGYYGQKSKVFRAANPAVMRALRSAYVGRKLKKRQYRQMWIARINAAARINGMRERTSPAGASSRTSRMFSSTVRQGSSRAL